MLFKELKEVTKTNIALYDHAANYIKRYNRIYDGDAYDNMHVWNITQVYSSIANETILEVYIENYKKINLTLHNPLNHYKYTDAGMELWTDGSIITITDREEVDIISRWIDRAKNMNVDARSYVRYMFNEGQYEQ